jgi:putative hydroxymethylpyrimidine transport system substrate-binding protein
MRQHKGMLLTLLMLVSVISLSCGEDEVTLALDWFPNANHTGLYVAMDRGYFEEEGIELQVYTPDDPATILATVGADKDDFGFEYQVGVLLARGQGVPVVSVAAIVQHPLNSVMALESSDIKRPRDLVGKTVGYPGIPTDPPLLRTMLEADHVSESATQEVVDGMVNVGFDLVPALISGRVDAIVGAYWTHESISARNQGFPLTVLRMEDWGVPDFYELVVVVSENKLRNDPKLIERFIRAIKRGYVEAAKDPASAVEILLKQVPEADPAIDRPGSALLAPLWVEEGIPSFGWQTTEKWSAMAKWMQNNDFLTSDLRAADAFTNHFIEQSE